MTFANKAFHYYENDAMTQWMNDRANEGFKVLSIVALSPNGVFVTMEKP